MDMSGPMFVTANRNGEIHLNEFDYQGLVPEFNSSKPITGTIAHYTLTSKLGIRCLKQLLQAKSLSDIYKTTMGQQGYKQAVNTFVAQLAGGDVLHPVSHYLVGEFLTKREE